MADVSGVEIDAGAPIPTLDANSGVGIAVPPAIALDAYYTAGGVRWYRREPPLPYGAVRTE